MCNYTIQQAENITRGAAKQSDSKLHRLVFPHKEEKQGLRFLRQQQQQQQAKIIADKIWDAHIRFSIDAEQLHKELDSE